MNKFVKPSLIGQQLQFMLVMRQKRFTLLETLQKLQSGDKDLRQAMQMGLDLIDEEFNKETKPIIKALLLTNAGSFHPDATDKQIKQLLLQELAVVFDGMIDTIYVCASFLNMFGFPGDEGWNEVQGANMSKAADCDKCGGTGLALNSTDCTACDGTGKIVKRREDGKVLKPDGWQAPDMLKLLVQQLDKDAR